MSEQALRDARLQRRGNGVRGGRVRPEARIRTDFLVEHVDGHAQMHGPWASASGDAGGTRNFVSRAHRRFHRPCGLGDRLRHVGLAKLLKRSSADLRAARMPRKKNHGSLGGERRIQGRDRVGVARPAGDQSDAHLTGDTRVGIGHVHTRSLVAAVNDIDARVDQCVVDRHDVIAGDRKYSVDADAFQRPGDEVGAAQSHADLCPASRRWRKSAFQRPLIGGSSTPPSRNAR